MSKLCKSCGGPVKDYPGKKVVNPDFCPYCCNEQGVLKSYKDIVDLMIEYLELEHKEVKKEKRADTAREWIKENPAWKDKYLSSDVVIEDVRETSFKDIPAMNDKYDCKKCMYYQTGPSTIKSKKKWFLKMNKKYGSVGKILYLKGEPAGFSQFATKKEFKKLEELEKTSTKTDSWYISCLAIKKEFHGKGLGKMLLKEVIRSLEKQKVKKIHAFGLIKGDASNYSSGYWSMYEKLGFKRIGGDDKFTVGELIIKN